MSEKRKDNKGRILKKGESQRKNGTYDYRFVDSKGKTHSVYAKTLDVLRQKEKEIERDIADGIDFAAGDEKVCDLVDRYMAMKRTIKPNTARSYSTVVKRIHVDAFGQRKIRSIKKSDAKAWFVKLHDEGLKRNTITVYKSVLQPAFEMAVDDDAIRKNPFRFNLSELLPDDEAKRVSLCRMLISPSAVCMCAGNSVGRATSRISSARRNPAAAFARFPSQTQRTKLSSV